MHIAGESFNRTPSNRFRFCGMAFPTSSRSDEANENADGCVFFSSERLNNEKDKRHCCKRSADCRRKFVSALSFTSLAVRMTRESRPRSERQSQQTSIFPRQFRTRGRSL